MRVFRPGLASVLAIMALACVGQGRASDFSQRVTHVIDQADGGGSIASSSTMHATAYPGGTWEPGPARYGVEIVNDVPVQTSDGITLRANVAYPTDLKTGRRAEGRFPVVIEHTPYIFNGNGPPNPFFTRYGYISAVVRARGTGASQGQVDMYGSRDREDGKDIVNWAARVLPGSDGRVVQFGCSYPGGLALGTAAEVGPNSPLKAVVVACNGFEGVLRQAWQFGGVPTTGFTNYPANAPKIQGNTKAVKDFYDRITAEIMSGGDAAYDGKFWSDRLMMSLGKKIADNHVPVLIWSGWQDMLGNSAVRAFTAMQNAAAGRPVTASIFPQQTLTPRYQIIMGEWHHAQGLDMGVYLEWFETWLKGVDTGLQKTSTPMHLYEGGTKRWVNVTHFPSVVSYTDWYLAPGQQLSLSKAGQGHDQLRFGDPDEASGKVIFTSEPAAVGTSLSGPVSATVYARTSNTNLELIARLYDVPPDGAPYLISKGAILGSQRALDNAKTWKDHNGTPIWPWQSLKRDDYLLAGRPYRFDISLGARQYGLMAGHRLRLELTTQSSKDICPSTGIPRTNGDDPCRLTIPQQKTLPGGVYTILFGPRWPSAVHLPQMAANAYPTIPEGKEPSLWDEHTHKVVETDMTLPLVW